MKRYIRVAYKFSTWSIVCQSGQIRTKCVQNLQNCIKVYKLVCRSIWMYIIEKCPEVFFLHVEQFLLAATPFFAYHNLLYQLLKVVHTSKWVLKWPQLSTTIEYVLVNAYLDIVSLKRALCDVSSIKKARCSLQVLACCLHHNLVKAHSDSGSSLTLEAWAELKCKYNPMFKYMYNIL